MDLEECPVEVRKSPTHGNGVFAKRNIKFGELVAYYDGTLAALTDLFHPYSMYWSEFENIIGFKNPRTSWGVAQLINDGTALTAEFILSHDEDEDACYRYIRESTTKQNVGMEHSDVYFGKNKMVATATRDIEKGEELFFTYGVGYWLHFIPYSLSKKGVRRTLLNRFQITCDRLGEDASIQAYQDDFYTILRLETKTRCVLTDLSTYDEDDLNQSIAKMRIMEWASG